MFSLSLLGLRWYAGGGTTGFFLMLFLVCLVLLRLRVPKAGWTSVLDVLACLAVAPIAVGVGLFAAMYYGMYFAAIAAVYVFFAVDMYAGGIAALAAGIGLLLRLWERERDKRITGRDTDASRYYQLETLQGDLMNATAQIERMTVVSERARISREIHDNAGHEIVAAYMSLQTARGIFDGADANALALYDAALQRLDTGVEKIREAVHNLVPVTALGIEALMENCERFPLPVNFNTFGDTRHVPVHVWNVLESCLNEALTNVAKHANPREISVQLDATAHIVRLCVENDGVLSKGRSIGTGLRNLRHRLTSAGGSLAVDGGDEMFRVVCVMPVQK